MKTKTQLAILLLFIVLNAFSQPKATEFFKTAKIHYNDGTISKVTMKVIEGTIHYSKLDSHGFLRDVPVEIEKVQKIEIAKNNPTSMIIGGIAGFGAGLATMLLVKSNYERTIQGPAPEVKRWICKKIYIREEYVNGVQTKQEYNKTMAFAPKAFMIGGATVLGILIGKSFKKWINYYPHKNLTQSGFHYGLGVSGFAGNMEFQLSYKF